MARQPRPQCKKLGWVVYAETFLAVVAFSYASMLCIDNAEEFDFGASMTPLAPAFPSFVVAKLETAEDVEPLGAQALGSREDVLRAEPGREKRCESKVPAFTTTFAIAFMAGGFMNVDRIQGLPIP